MKTAMKKTKAPLIVDMTIPVKQLIDAPFNHRKTFIDAEIEVIAESMKIHGVLQPLAVRLAPEHKAGAPMYQVLSGGKRLQAAIRAGLKVVPCRVHDGADDRQAKAISLVANLHSAPSPMEKGAGIRELMDAHDLTAAGVAELLGESVSAIRALIALKNLPELAEGAVKSGRLPIATAGLIAGLPTTEQRERLTLQVLTGNATSEPHAEELDSEFDPLTFVEAKELIKKQYQRQLKGCAWDLKDKTLHPDGIPCTTCPKRSGNAVKLNPDIDAGGRGDMCLDTTCFAIKSNACRTAALAKAEAAGMKALTGYLASQVGLFNSAYLFLDHDNKYLPFALPNGTTLREFLADMKVELAGVMLAVNDDGLSREIVNTSWALRMVTPKAPSPAPSPKGNSKPAKEKPPEPFRFEKPALATPPPEEPAEDAHRELLDLITPSYLAAEKAIPAVLSAVRGHLHLADVTAESNAALRALALASVEYFAFDDPDEKLMVLEKARDIEGVGPMIDDMDLAPWAAWIARASAIDLVMLLAEIQVRSALDGLPGRRACRELLKLANLDRDTLIVEARQQEKLASATA